MSLIQSNEGSRVRRSLWVNSSHTTAKRLMLLAAFLTSSLAVSKASAQSAPGSQKPGEPEATAHTAASITPVWARAVPRSGRQAMMYRRLWGVDNLQVKQTASGELIRFSYTVVDATKAKPLNDKRETPYLIDASTGARLEVPQTEKVGQLRQVATPVNGREYFMVFFNQHGVVKPGNRVSLVIGKFRIDGLTVE